MRGPVGSIILSVLGGLVLILGCQSAQPKAAPPSARRPVIKSQDELTAERAAAIERGEIVPTTAPVLFGEARATARHAPTATPPSPGAIEPDILMVNDSVLTVADVLYPLREDIAAARAAQTPTGFREVVQRLVREQAQRDIGAVLIYHEATAKLQENQRKALEAAVTEQMDGLTASEFGGSTARMKAHLAAHGLTMDQLKQAVERDLVVRQYTREKLMPQVQIRRSELWAEYQRNINEYSSPEARELLLIEVPFAHFLPDKITWETASKTTRAAAKLSAMRQVREAAAALADQPFEEVARKYSIGPHADQGGTWGLIARPLQPPYADVSKLIFEYESGQTSEPIETEIGWCIVRCGQIEPASERPFLEVQDEIRRTLMERRFARLSTEYVLRLANRATISSFDAFVTAAVTRAEKQPADLDSTQ